MLTEKKYGQPPVDLGMIDLSVDEMMFWMYCPVKLKSKGTWQLPDNLQKYESLLEEVNLDIYDRLLDEDKWLNSYIYMTAKTLWVTADNPGNRPGWHSDGFLTEDLNYLWYDDNPTIFWEPKELVAFEKDHQKSLMQMEEVTGHGPYKTYPCKHLLCLDETVIHRVANVAKPGMRTFIKISVSSDKYDLKGNSINYKLNTGCDLRDRQQERNPPSKET